MNRLMNWLLKPERSSASIERKSFDGLVAFHGAAAPAWSVFETSGATAGFTKNPIVYRCVRMISEAAASIPMKAHENRLDCDQHPLLDHSRTLLSIRRKKELS